MQYVLTEGKVKSNPAEKLGKHKIKPHLPRIIKHHKEKGYKRSKEKISRIKKDIKAFSFSEKHTDKADCIIEHTENNSAPYCPTENCYLAYKRLGIIHRNTLEKKDVAFG